MLHLGEAVQQLEQEAKLEIGTDWSLPDLSGVLPGVRAHPMPDLSLETTYFDTADLRLARRHVTLRFRRETEAVPRSRRRGNGPTPPSRTSEVWTVKLPSSSDGTLLTRTELTWPAATSALNATPGVKVPPRRPPAPASGRGRQSLDLKRNVHPEAAQFVQSMALGQPLRPVAHLTATRQRTELRTSDGRRLAEIDQDLVRGRALSTSEGRDVGDQDAADEVCFNEVEVELAEGSSLEILDAVIDKLQDSGAKPSPGGSKLATVLGLSDGPAASAKRRREATMSEVLQEQARSCLDVLLDHDPAIRIGDPDPEHIHRARVATRRLRSVLRAFAPLVSGKPAVPGKPDVPGEAGDSRPTWFAELSEDLKWFGGTLGTARDADVRLQSLERDCATLPSLDSPGAAALLGAAREQQASSHQDLLDAMATGHYLELLRELEALASRAGSGLPEVPVQFWSMLSQPAAEGMPSLAQHQWRSARKAVARLGDKPADDQLHTVRIQAKRLRYMAEVAAPVVRRPEDRRAATSTARAAAALQDVLGDLHDAVVREQWLRDAASRRPARAKAEALVATGVAAGQLIAAAQERQRAQRSAWAAAWDQLDRKKLLHWVGAG